jgi:hypothetical protein
VGRGRERALGGGEAGAELSVPVWHVPV